jgi:hypothetical protein
MLEIYNIEVHGLERSLKASGNPMTLGQPNTTMPITTDADVVRGKRLGQAARGSGHDNFLSGIVVWFDVKYPLYWSPEFQRYHFAQIISSQSTMHRLTTAGKGDDFNKMFNKYVSPEIIEHVNMYIDEYNELSEWSISDEDCKYHHPDHIERYDDDEFEKVKYEAFMRARSNLPSGYEMWMSVTTNYLQLKTMYSQRKNHKLKEDWGAFIQMCEELPMFLELTQKGN